MYVWISTRMCTSFTSPDDRMLFIYSRKASSFISLSVNKNVTPLPCWPAVRYRYFRSSRRLLTLYDLKNEKQNENQNLHEWHMIKTWIPKKGGDNATCWVKKKSINICIELERWTSVIIQCIHLRKKNHSICGFTQSFHKLVTLSLAVLTQ